MYSGDADALHERPVGDRDEGGGERPRPVRPSSSRRDMIKPAEAAGGLAEAEKKIHPSGVLD